MKESEDILRKMLTETREIPVDHVPYAFEKRIMAHIEAAPQAAINLWQQWSQSPLASRGALSGCNDSCSRFGQP